MVRKKERMHNLKPEWIARPEFLFRRFLLSRNDGRVQRQQPAARAEAGASGKASKCKEESEQRVTCKISSRFASIHSTPLYSHSLTRFLSHAVVLALAARRAAHPARQCGHRSFRRRGKDGGR